MINGLLSSCTSNRGAKYCNSRICLSVCLSARICQEVKRPNFMKFSVVCYPWPWFDPALTTVDYVMYFQFVDDVMFSHNGPLWHVALALSTSAPCERKQSKFPTYSPEGATLYEFVDIYNGSKLWTGASLVFTIVLLSPYCHIVITPWCPRHICEMWKVFFSSLDSCNWAYSVDFRVIKYVQKKVMLWSVANILQVVCGFLHERPSF